jgi:hypothetical protein
MLHYATTLHPDFSFLLMERRFKSLQKMFNDARQVQHNIQACECSLREGLDIQGYGSEYEQENIEWNFEHRFDNIIASLEVFNAHNFAKDEIPLIEKGDASLTPDPF